MSQDQELIKVTAIVEREFEERSKLFYNQYLLDKQHEVLKVQIREQIRREYPDFPFYIKYVQHVPRPRGYRAANQLHMSQHSGVNQDDVNTLKRKLDDSPLTSQDQRQLDSFHKNIRLIS